MIDTTRYHYTECDCRDPGHLVRFFRDDNPEFTEYGVSLQMAHYLPWWRRIAVAMRYVLAIDHRRCHWVDATWTEEQRKAIAEFLK